MENIVKLENATLIHGDCITEIQNIEDNSIDFSVFSPPFASLYTFSDDERDLSNCNSTEEFMQHFSFLLPELNRITQDGRLVAVHCMDLTTNINRDGYLSIVDFRAEIVKLFQEYDFLYHNEITIWKDPVLEVTRTKNVQLLYNQFCKDSSISRTSLPDRILIFRKKGKNQNPIRHNRQQFTPQQWGKLASPIWMDIKQSRTLNSIKGTNDERHISALQLDVIERLIYLWSNPNDTVFSPFMGIGSEGYQSILMNRKFVGIELKKEYFEQSVKNISSAIQMTKQENLFI